MIIPKTLNIKAREITGLPWWVSSKESADNAGDGAVIPKSGRSPGEGNDKLHRYSCLGNPRTEEPGGLHTVHGVAESDTTE